MKVVRNHAGRQAYIRDGGLAVQGAEGNEGYSPYLRPGDTHVVLNTPHEILRLAGFVMIRAAIEALPVLHQR